MPAKKLARPQEKDLRFAVLATDAVAFRLGETGTLEVLLITATTDAFKGQPALPGGLIAPEETAEQAVVRHLTNKAGLFGGYLEQLYTFSDVDRDPRGRVVSVAYTALFSPHETVLAERAATHNAEWCPMQHVPHLAYDHDHILNTAVARLQARITYTTIIRHLMPREFTLTELQKAYEAILGHEMDKRNFRKKILAVGVLNETKRKKTEGLTRPATLYTFAGSGVKTIEVV
jgi:8-oxo-dGTP diphosphatase